MYRVHYVDTEVKEELTQQELLDKFGEEIFSKILVVKQFDRLVLESKMFGRVRIKKVRT